MKFGDIVIAVASFAFVSIFLIFILGLGLIPAIGWDSGPAVTELISVLLSGLIVGAIFSRTIWEEAGIKSIAKIIIFLGALLILFYAASIPSQGDWTPAVKETFQNTNPGKTLTTSQWFMVESYALIEEIVINMAIWASLGFVGLYVGSMLRKPKKS